MQNATDSPSFISGEITENGINHAVITTNRDLTEGLTVG